MSPRHRGLRNVAVDEELAGQVADTMFALSTLSRVQILACLAAGPQSVSDLMAALGMEQSAVSHQLRVLLKHELVSVVKVGRHRVYALHDDHVEELLDTTLRQIADRDRRRRPGRGLTGAAGASGRG
ncbi:MAG: ArsR/SmtB family transcription factor [Acidimicrobiales bacterium]